MNLFTKNRKGFTLTELMVVVAILGILVLIAIPVYNGLDSQAKKAANDANIRTLKSVVLQYCLTEGFDQTKIDITATVGSSGVTLVAKEDSAIIDLSAKPIIPKYIEEWPVSPYDKSKTYNVKGSNTGLIVEDQYNASSGD